MCRPRQRSPPRLCPLPVLLKLSLSTVMAAAAVLIVALVLFSLVVALLFSLVVVVATAAAAPLFLLARLWPRVISSNRRSRLPRHRGVLGG